MIVAGMDVKIVKKVSIIGATWVAAMDKTLNTASKVVRMLKVDGKDVALLENNWLYVVDCLQDVNKPMEEEKPAPKKEEAKKVEADIAFKVGDLVRIVKPFNGWPGFVNNMMPGYIKNKTIGIIKTVNENIHGRETIVSVDFGTSTYAYPVSCLEKVVAEPAPVAAPKEKKKKRAMQVGDLVEVYRKVEWRVWMPDMKVGKRGRIQDIAEFHGKKCALLDDGLYYPLVCLKRI